MALLARLVGVRARVGMGYTCGTRRARRELVRDRRERAHLAGAAARMSWLRLEPTPRRRRPGSAIVPRRHAKLIPGSDGLRNGRPGSARAPPRPVEPVPRLDTQRPGQRPNPAARSRSNRSRDTDSWILAALALVVLLCVPAALRRLSSVYRRARTGSDADVAAAPPHGRGYGPPRSITVRRGGRATARRAIALRLN